MGKKIIRQQKRFMKQETKNNPKIYNGNWYQMPEIYDRFSEAEDREDICFKIIEKKLQGFKIKNPIDLAAGTGRVSDYILRHLKFTGVLYSIENEPAMRNFLENKYDNWESVVIKTPLNKAKDHPLLNSVKSNFIISRFGFPSKIWDKKLAYEELLSVYEMLDQQGIFITIGWDEEFSDELNKMWYMFVPDGIQADNFIDWCGERKQVITSPRNTHLTLFKKNIETSLKYDTLQESVYIMGTLFGYKAIKWIVDNDKTQWQMSCSITWNTKEQLRDIIKKYETRN